MLRMRLDDVGPYNLRDFPTIGLYAVDRLPKPEDHKFYGDYSYKDPRRTEVRGNVQTAVFDVHAGFCKQSQDGSEPRYLRGWVVLHNIHTNSLWLVFGGNPYNREKFNRPSTVEGVLLIKKDSDLLPGFFTAWDHRSEFIRTYIEPNWLRI